MLHYVLLIQHFFLLSYLNYIIMSINSLYSSSTVLTNYLPTHTNTLHSFLLHFATSVNTYLTKSLPHINPNLTILGKACILYSFFHYAGNFLPIMLALCSMLLPLYYAQNYAGIIGSSLTLTTFTTTRQPA